MCLLMISMQNYIMLLFFSRKIYVWDLWWKSQHSPYFRSFEPNFWKIILIICSITPVSTQNPTRSQSDWLNFKIWSTHRAEPFLETELHHEYWLLELDYFCLRVNHGRYLRCGSLCRYLTWFHLLRILFSYSWNRKVIVNLSRNTNKWTDRQNGSLVAV